MPNPPDKLKEPPKDITPYCDLKDKKWRVERVEELPKKLLDEIEQLMQSIVDAVGLAHLVHDFEICGSYAFGCAELGSDIDLNVSAKDWTDQKVMEKILMADGRRLWAEAKSLAAQFSHAHKIKVDIMFMNPDCRTYGYCYSLKERKIYGRKAGETVRVKGRWNEATQKWRLIPKPTRKFECDHMD
jgi:predicted nucleotidyltransferase